MKTFAILSALAAVALASSSYEVPSSSVAAYPTYAAPSSSEVATYPVSTPPAPTTYPVVTPPANSTMSTVYYTSSCPTPAGDVTVTREPVTSPCPNCPTYTVSYSTGSSAIVVPPVATGTAVTPPIATGAANAFGISGAAGAMALAAMLL